MLPIHSEALESPIDIPVAWFCLNVVPAPAVTVIPAFGCHTPTVQQLFSTVVTVFVMLVCAVAVFVCDASGIPVCFAPVYDIAIPEIAHPPVDVVMLTLFAPVAGFAR